MMKFENSEREKEEGKVALDSLPRNVLDSLLEGCQVIGFDWKYLYVNDSVARHGHTAKENLLGRTMMEAYPGIDNTAMFQVLKSCMSERVPQCMDNEFVYPDGSVGWFELRIEPVPEGVLVLSVDITERRRAEDSLRRSNRKLRVLSDCNQTIVWASAEETIFKRMCELLVETGCYGLAWIGLIDGGAEEADSETKRGANPGTLGVAACSGASEDIVAVERFAMRECGREKSPTRQAIVAGEPLFAERSDQQDIDPEWRDDIARLGLSSCVALPLRESGNVIGALTVYSREGEILDEGDRLLLNELASDASYGVTMLRVRARHDMIGTALRDSEERYRTLVENLDDVVFAIDQSGHITYVSGAVTRYGYAPDKVVGRPFSTFIHPDDLAGVQESFEDVLNERLSPYEFRMLNENGDCHYVRSSSRPAIKDGQVVGITGVLLDFTERRKIEEQLRLAQKLEAVGQLAGGVAHDFNNILTVINTYASLGLEELRAEDPLREDLAQIKEAGDRAAVLTRQLLAFSRKQVLKPQVISLNRIVSGFEEMLRRLIGEHIKLETKLDSNLDAVKVDPGQIEQVIMNLAVNARDAMPNGGELLIETSGMELSDESLQQGQVLKPGRYVVLSVSDSGCGMNEETKTRIFEPFFTTKESGKGTGLGLSTVYGIVKQSRGDIRVYSEPNIGTTFRVYLPSESKLPESDRASLGQEIPSGGSEIILVIEDEPAIQALAKRILTTAGYKVMTAANGAEAMMVSNSSPDRIDLVLSDVVLPGMSSREIATRLQVTNPGMKILFMSGYTADAVARQYSLDESRDFISKPFTAPDLTRMVRAVLDR